jgi:hypothetical protein
MSELALSVVRNRFESRHLANLFVLRLAIKNTEPPASKGCVSSALTRALRPYDTRENVRQLVFRRGA